MNFLIKKTTSGSYIKNKKMPELRKPIIRKFEKRRVHSPFIDNVWGADLADKQLLFKFNKRNLFFIMRSCYFQVIRMGYSFER